MLPSANSTGRAPPRIATIGVGYDGSRGSEKALALGRELAAAHGARIRVMEVVCPPRALFAPREAAELGGRVDRLLLQARERLAKLEGVDSCAVYGIAEDELAAFAEEVDLLVIGLSSHDGAGRTLTALGIAAYLERHARCPVLVVPRPLPTCAPRGAHGANGSSRSLRRARSCAL